MASGDGPHGSHQEGLVVAHGEVAEDLALHAHRRVDQQGRAGGAEPPVDRRELVDDVPGLLAEEAGQVALWSAPSRWSPMPGERSATARVWFTFEMQTRKFGGSMLHCVTKPARQPLMSCIGRADRDDVEGVVDEGEERRRGRPGRRSPVVRRIRRPEAHRRSSTP